MLIVWRGYGWLIPIIVFGGFLSSQAVLNSIYGEGFYKANDWPKLAAIGVSSLLVAALGYWFNYKKRQVFIDPETGNKKKSPSHTLFFIPVEAWALIIPVAFFWLESNTAQTNAQEMAYIESPAVNDIYSVDFTKLFTESDEKFKYGTLLVVDVKQDGVEVLASDMAYDGKSGVRKDIRKGKASAKSYYSGESFFISTQFIQELKNTGGVFQVSRR
ncbi:hypothetical protein [Motilimonas sp. KMU-193]|uniref:hypothetical protein n=1 Tax=Motilimonas sp. KMU-193 TaxID=3388668 RepID=UPI00396B1138